MLSGSGTSGDWEVLDGTVFGFVSKDTGTNGANVYTQLEQAGRVLVYEWTVEFVDVSEGNGAGMHLLAEVNTPRFSGVSYLILQRANALVAFRVQGSDYSDSRTLSSSATAKNGDIFRYCVEVNTETGELTVYRNGEFIAAWKPSGAPITTGQYVTARTNNASAIFTNIRYTVLD